MKSGILILQEPSGPVQACNGIALLYRPKFTFWYRFLFPFHLDDTGLRIIVSYDIAAKTSHLYKIESRGRKKKERKKKGLSAKTKRLGTMNIQSQF
jgi:hypothetical protein